MVRFPAEITMYLTIFPAVYIVKTSFLLSCHEELKGQLWLIVVLRYISNRFSISADLYSRLWFTKRVVIRG